MEIKYAHDAAAQNILILTYVLFASPASAHACREM